jgi:thioredoxin-related protein
LILIGFPVFAQVNIYNPSADAKADISNALIHAKNENKHVFIQIGGNWCPWCFKLTHFLSSDSLINDVLTKNYIVVKVNYSKENKNWMYLSNLKNRNGLVSL